MSALMAEKCNSVSLSCWNIVYSSFVIMYCCNLICYLYTIVLIKVTRNKDIYKESRQKFHVLKNTNGSDKGCLMVDGKCYSHHIGKFC